MFQVFLQGTVLHFFAQTMDYYHQRNPTARAVRPSSRHGGDRHRAAAYELTTKVRATRATGLLCVPTFATLRTDNTCWIAPYSPAFAPVDGESSDTGLLYRDRA
jgi:hypothetical protein